MDQERKYLKEEIRKEFQLERMILFSDAVFAIVITLMAIEIHLPEGEKYTTDTQLAHELKKVLPYILAYTISFFYIGLTWYQHLQLFSLLKDYDKGLVVRNLIMLFFLGFFPFSVSLVTRPSNIFLNATIYFAIIFLSRSAQLVLQHYILVRKPLLRINADIEEEMLHYKKSRLAVGMLLTVFILVSATYYLITDPEQKYYAWWWFIPFPFILKFFNKRIKRKNP